MAANRDAGPLRLLLQFLRAQDSGDPYAFRFEAQDYILPTPGGASPTARFEWSQGVLDDLQAVRRPGRDPAVVQRLGERLRRFVEPAGWALHEAAIAEAIDEERPIFLTIRSSAAELYALPWELLTLKSSNRHIGRLAGMLVRFEWPETRTIVEQPRPSPEGGRILVAWAAAGRAVPADQHIAAIENAARQGIHPFDRERDVLAQASLAGIVRVLKEAQETGPRIAVLHLLCHGAPVGNGFGLCLQGQHESVVVDAGQVRDMLAPFAKMVRLVVVSACDSSNIGAPGNALGSVAQELHRCGFASVIASRFPLSVAGSITLTTRLYDSLLTGPASLEDAFLAARNELAQSETSIDREYQVVDWASVQLYARHQDGDDARPIVFRPYRGLLAFQPEHRRFFCGRDKEAKEVVEDLKALIAHKMERFLIVAGGSGTGKSSLVLAGAVPKLAHPGLVFLRMRPGGDPERALTDALAQRPAEAKALLLVDQFEELFTQTASPAVRGAFVRRLWSLATTEAPDICVIVTLRVDFISRLGELVVNDAGRRLDSVAYDEAHRVFVAQLEPGQLRAAIVEPARKVGLALQAGLVERMMEDVGAEPGALPLLEDTLDVLWQQREGHTLTQQAYDQLGGVVGALRKRADAILEKLAQEGDLAIAERLLVSLVAVADETTLDTRLRVPLADLQELVPAAEIAGFERVLKQLVAARLLVQDGNAKDSTVEVAHEALIRKWPRLHGWVDDNRAGLVVQRRIRQAAHEWERQQHEESLLYRGGTLTQASEWRRSWESRLGDLERKFLDASEALRTQTEAEVAERQRREREAREQQLAAAQKLARRTRLAAVVLGVLLLGVTVAGAQAYRKSVEAKERLLTAIAPTIKEDPTEVASLLREAEHSDFTFWIQSAVDVLQTRIATAVLRGHWASVNSVKFSPDGTKIATASSDEARIYNADGSGIPVVLTGYQDVVTAVAWSPDGTKVATGSCDNTLRIWMADGSGSKVERSSPHGCISAVVFSPNGNKVVSGASDGSALIWDAITPSDPIVLTRHGAMVTSVAFSPDGTKVATGSEDRTARVFDASGLGSYRVLGGHQDDVLSVAFSPDGTKVATGSRDRTIRIWNADSARCLAVLDRHTLAVHAVAYSPDGKKLASGSADQTARIWSADGSGTPVVLTDHLSEIYSIAWSPDGQYLVTGSRDKTARIWRTSGASMPVELTGHRAFIYSAAFSPDGKKVVTGSDDRTARITNVDGSGVPVVLRGHGSFIYSVAFSPDGTKVLTGSEDKTARLWNADGTGVPIVLRGHDRVIYSVAFSPDGRKVLTGSGDNTARIFDADGTGVPIVLRGHDSDITSVAFSSNGKKVVTGSADQTVRIWEIDKSSAPVVLSRYQSSANTVAFSPDGAKFAAGFDDGTARIDSADGSSNPVVLTGHEAPVKSVAFSPDGARLITGSWDGTARIWKVDRSGAPTVLSGHLARIYAVAFSPDGKKIATGSLDETARVFNADGSGTPIILKGHGNAVKSVAFSPDGEKIATGSVDTMARIYSADGSGTPTVIARHQDRVNAVAFSPDGKWVATGSNDYSARIWSTDESAPAIALRGHRDSVTSVAFSPDGKKVATGCDDRIARIYDATGYGTPILLSGHQGSVLSVAFSPGGRRVATGSSDRTARIWNANGSGQPIILAGHQAGVTAVAFSPDGRQLATGSNDDLLRIWNADGSGAPVVLKGGQRVTSVAWSPDGTKIATGSLDGRARIWLVASDSLASALWDATSDCLPVGRRQELLLESFREATQGNKRCRQAVAYRRGWPAPK